MTFTERAGTIFPTVRLVPEQIHRDEFADSGVHVTMQNASLVGSAVGRGG